MAASAAETTLVTLRSLTGGADVSGAAQGVIE